MQNIKNSPKILLILCFVPKLALSIPIFVIFPIVVKKQASSLKEILSNPYIYLDKKEIEKLELYEILIPDVQKIFNECWAELLRY